MVCLGHGSAGNLLQEGVAVAVEAAVAYIYTEDVVFVEDESNECGSHTIILRHINAFLRDKGMCLLNPLMEGVDEICWFQAGGQAVNEFLKRLYSQFAGELSTFVSSHSVRYDCCQAGVGLK